MVEAVADNPALLAALLADSQSTTRLWQPTAYWQNYTGRITREIERTGLAEFRSNHTICKGYAFGGVPEPLPPVSPWKQVVWNGLINAPAFSTVIGAYRAHIASEHRNLRRAEIRYARVVLDRLADAHPGLRIPSGIANGGPDDAFGWRGRTVTASWVEQLCRIADFYAVVPADQVKTIVEIGPGIGQSTLAHLAINPSLQTIVNVDIVPVLYVSTQFLDSTEEFEVADYLELREASEITLSAGKTKPRLLQVPPWQFERLKGPVDFFFNAYSFQEMEKDVCRNYVDTILPDVTGGAMLHSSIQGHAPGAGGQKEPVDMDFITGLFAGKFGTRRSASSLSTEFYGLAPDAAQLMT